MNVHNLVMGLVGLAVMIMVLTAVVIPAVQDAQEQQYTTANNTDIRFTTIFPDSDTRYEITFTTAGGLYVNGELIKGTKNLTQYSTLISADSFSLQVDTNNLICAVVGETPTYSVNKWVIQNGVLYWVNSSDVESQFATFDWVILPFNSGTHCSAFYDGTVYINEGGTFWVKGSAAWFNESWTSGNAILECKISEGAVSVLSADIVYYDGENVGTSTSTEGVTVALTDLVKVDELHYSLTFATITTASGTNTANLLFVPVEYEFIDSDDGSIRALFGLIPLLLIIVAVLYAVRLMGTSRN